MRERGHGDRLDVVGEHEVAPGSAARQRASLRSARLPRGLAPTAALCEVRVAATRSTQYSRTLSATWTGSTARCISSSVSRSITRRELDLVRLALDAAREDVDLVRRGSG